MACMTHQDVAMREHTHTQTHTYTHTHIHIHIHIHTRRRMHIHTYTHALTPFEIFTLTQFLYEERRQEF